MSITDSNERLTTIRISCYHLTIIVSILFQYSVCEKNNYTLGMETFDKVIKTMRLIWKHPILTKIYFPEAIC